ncbi:hypothetical protein HEP74_02056 [Xanthomonas sp. SS]|uniref:ZrgA family zinc uptake protein n=1 Tax=Xanthomonas sp. SS TaxID=2724122 RepID=UPI00186206D8|nr:DUF2796 domain-containing protein [Xanthomonas sp. SS]QNH16916.1 hypothetical protein HEP74_02056 [Xanthomonas sp. SS]
MRHPIPLFLLLASASLPVAAIAVRHHGPHVHGQANLDVAVDGTALEVQLSAPGIGILDFEHPARDADERQRLDAAVATLRGARWLQFPVAAACSLRSAQVNTEGYDVAMADPDEPGHSHAEFHAHYAFQCAHPARLDHLQVLLPQRFAGLHKVVVNVATAAGQDRTEAVAGQTRVNLPG